MLLQLLLKQSWWHMNKTDVDTYAVGCGKNDYQIFLYLPIHCSI